MTIEVTTDPLRADEAWEWFQHKVPISKLDWLALDEQARRRAFTAAGVSSLDVLNFVWREMDRAINEGTSFGDFQKTVGPSLERQWGGKNPARVENIFRTNIQHAYAAGRYQQMTDPEVMDDRPYWEFVAVLDSGTTPICRPLEGTVRHAKDPWWDHHYPPLHFQCRSSVMTLMEHQAEGKGAHPAPHAQPPLRGFGGTPSQTEWAPDQHDYPAGLWHQYTTWQQGRQGQP